MISLCNQKCDPKCCTLYLEHWLGFGFKISKFRILPGWWLQCCSDTDSILCFAWKSIFSNWTIINSKRGKCCFLTCAPHARRHMFRTASIGKGTEPRWRHQTLQNFCLHCKSYSLCELSKKLKSVLSSWLQLLLRYLHTSLRRVQSGPGTATFN